MPTPIQVVYPDVEPEPIFVEYTEGPPGDGWIWIANIGWVFSDPDKAQEPDEPTSGLPANWQDKKAEPATPKDMQEVEPLPQVYLPISAEGAIIPVAYGEVMIPAKYGVIHARDGDPKNLYFLLIWCQGEVNAILDVYAGQETIGPGKDRSDLGIHNFTGASGQGIDSFLSNTTWGIGASYTDTLDGLCYSVVEMDAVNMPTLPRWMAHIEGLKVFDPRISSTAYSTNGALHYRDAAIKMGLLVNDTRVNDVADECDTLVSGLKRRQSGIYFDHPADSYTTLKVLAEYAGAIHYIDGDTAQLIANRPKAVTTSFTFTETDGTKFKVKNGTFKLAKKSTSQSPNRIILEYTDKSGFPWRRVQAIGPVPGGDTLISTRMSMPGIQTFSVANRARIERQNRYNLTDLEVEFEAFDEALEIEPGDVFDFDTDDLTAKQFRCNNMQASRQIGHWRVGGEEYDPAVFSDVSVTEPTYPDTTLPDPSVIPVGPSPDSIVERLWTDEGGKTYSVFDITFTGLQWRWTKFYRVKVFSATTTILDQLYKSDGEGATHKAQTGPTEQDLEYTIEISIINVDGKEGAVNSPVTTKTGDGKTLLPSNVDQVSLISVEFGQVVWLRHAAAADTDLRGYRYKRLLKTDFDAAADDNARWNHANVSLEADRHDSTQIQLPAQPVGTYMYGVKALDSVPSHESVLAAWVEQEVTADIGASIALETRLNGTAVNMHVYDNWGAKIGGKKATSFRAGDSMVDRFGAQTNPWPADQTESFNFGFTFASSIECLEWDTTNDRTGNWAYLAQSAVGNDGTTLVREILVATAAAHPTFTTFPGNAVPAQARYMKSKHSVVSAANAGFTVLFPIDLSHQGSIKEETLIVSVPVSPQPHTFTWVKDFTSKPDYSFVVEDTEPVLVAFDAVDKDGGKVRAWAQDGHTEPSGDPVATTVVLSAKGA